MALTDLRELGFPYTLNKLKLAELLAQRYPDYKWELVYLLKGRLAQQTRLEKAIRSLFQVGPPPPLLPPPPPKIFEYGKS